MVGRLSLLLTVLYMPTGLASEIELPPEPRVISPPASSRERTLERDTERMRQMRQERDTQHAPEAPKRSGQIQGALIAESLKERPMYFAITIQSGIVAAIIDAPRKDYQLDPTTGIKLYWRFNQNLPTNQNQLYLGARLQSFTGTGLYKNVPGRFGFVYYGPMVAIGKFSLAVASSGDAAVAQTPRYGGAMVRRGYLLSAGISAVSRFVATAADIPSPGEEFSSGDTYESPGIWSEARYSWIHVGAVSVDAFAGVQLSRGKNFLYFGAGVGAWH